MVSPVAKALSGVVSSAGSAFSSFIAPITKVVDRATTIPGQGGNTPTNIPDPALPSPAQQPTAKPGRKGMQQSFMSGVAASGLPGQGQSGKQGKTLLGQ